jgi:hypothetical protein
MQIISLASWWVNTILYIDDNLLRKGVIKNLVILFFKPKLNLMKKMNFVFRSRVFDGVNSRKSLMIFAMLFMIGFGFNTVSAQYVSTEVATQRLRDASADLTKNWETIQQSGNEQAIERAGLKLSVISRMLTDLKEGAAVKTIVDKYMINPGKTTVKDFQIGDDPKNGHYTGWLKVEILEMLEL